jgi:competence protein ComEC
MISRSLGHRSPLLWIVLPFVGGLILGKITGSRFVLSPLWLAFGSATIALMTCRNNRPYWSVAMVVAMLLAGAGSYSFHRARLPSWDLLPTREAQLSLEIDRVFIQADPKRATGLATVTRAGEHLRDRVGQREYLAPTLRKGDVAPLRSMIVRAVGVLVTLPADPPPATFDSYLAGAGINFRLTRGRVIAVEKPASAYYRFCADAGSRFHDILGRGIAVKRPELAGLLRAMMLGTIHELSDEQHTLFMQSGTMHLFAISGLNIGVVAGALQTLLLLFRFPPWARF